MKKTLSTFLSVSVSQWQSIMLSSYVYLRKGKSFQFQFRAELVSILYLPPVRRDLIAKGNTDPYLSIFYDSALISKGWLDPDPFQSSSIFQNLIESVVSGREVMSQAINQAHNELNLLLQK